MRSITRSTTGSHKALLLLDTVTISGIAISDLRFVLRRIRDHWTLVALISLSVGERNVSQIRRKDCEPKDGQEALAKRVLRGEMIRDWMIRKRK